MLVLQVPGLAPGASTNPFNADVGYICFVRSSGNNDLETKIAKEHNKRVRRPFIEQLRKRNSGYVPGTEVPHHLTSVGWIDGEWGQLLATTNEENLDESVTLKLVDCKGNPARTGTEQAADLTPIFKVLNKLQKNTTLKDKDSPFKRLLQTTTIGSI
jgi:hypothetical protein